MPSNEHERIPLTVIGRFLGAGKTTYLNALIREGVPQDSLIVVNDFGDINIDAELIEYRDDRILQLSNGCICCTLGGTLAEQLAAALRLRSRPGAVFIETSGVADPARVGDIARVSRRFELAAVICLVDASQARRHAADALTGDVWRAQLAAASRLLINRLPLADSEKRTALLAWLASFNAELEVMPGRDGEEEEGAGKAHPSEDASDTGRESAPAMRWKAITVTLPEPIEAAWLEATLYRYADVLLRAKGFVTRLDRDGVQVVQFSGGRLGWQHALRAPERHQLVCIGRDGERFAALLDALRHPAAMSGTR